MQPGPSFCAGVVLLLALVPQLRSQDEPLRLFGDNHERVIILETAVRLLDGNGLCTVLLYV